MELLRKVDAEQLQAYLEDEDARELIAEEIIKLISVFYVSFRLWAKIMKIVNKHYL